MKGVIHSHLHQRIRASIKILGWSYPIAAWLRLSRLETTPIIICMILFCACVLYIYSSIQMNRELRSFFVRRARMHYMIVSFLFIHPDEK